MKQIQILPDDLINKIAAGEVIERPASVVKELVENSIDSGSTSITVNLKAGGKSLIEIIDNGSGMDYNNTLMAFERHGTSKIGTFEELENLHSLGFRGEALPSIAAVSRIELLTNNTEDDMGTWISFDFGTLKEAKKAAAPKGTKITVMNLFGKLPARQKFMKSNSIELKHILDIITSIAMVYDNIAFVVIHNGKEILNLPAAQSKEERLIKIFGHDRIQHMILIHEEIKDMKLIAFVGKPDQYNEYIKKQSYIFVNDRPINNYMIYSAAKEGFYPYIQKQNLPQFILYFSIDPLMLDVNVHPTKKEVRFTHSQSIYHFVKESFQKAFDKYFSENTKEEIISDTRPVNYNQGDSGSQNEEFMQPRFSFNPSRKEEEPKRNNGNGEYDDIIPWQLKNAYIVAQLKDGMLLIDQHAAHERILFEKALDKLRGKKFSAQQLLFPLILDLPINNAEVYNRIVVENEQYFRKLGFIFKPFSGRSLIVEAVPAEIKHLENGDQIIEMLDFLMDLYLKDKMKENIIDNIARAYACKSAIKSGQKLSVSDMRLLIDLLFSTKIPYACPHGRPTTIKVTIDEIEKRFKRK